MAVIRMKGVKIKNLDQLREHFDFTNAKDYLLQGTLSAWMREQGETELAHELNELKDQNYSDQTLADNFAGIFGLEQTISVAETTAEIVVAENSGNQPVKTNEIIVGNSSFSPASCFGETGIVYIDEEKLSRYGLEKSSGSIDDIRKLAKNRLALYLVFKVANTVMHEDFLKENKCQWTLELGTRFCDVGWSKADLDKLLQKLNKYFSMPACLTVYNTYLGDLGASGRIMIVSVQQLLDFIGRDNVTFKKDKNYKGKFTHLCANGCFEALSLRYGE